jgi:FAD/FMN-containing dehydrogenase
MVTGNETLSRAASLRASIEGEVVLPGDEGWDAARQAWNLAVDQRPELVVLPESAQDVKQVVAFAGSAGLPVAVQGTGHGAVPRGSLEGCLLLNMARLDAVEVDPERRTVRVEAGALWGSVAEKAGEHGLAGLAGSSRDVGVVGYTLNGGIGWLGRKYGLASDSVRAIEVVTADGRHRRVDGASDPELFWALRGGGGSFGAVTAMELELFPVSQIFAGGLYWPVERAPDVLRSYAAWADGVPDEVSSCGRILHVPPLPVIPEPLRGRSWAVVEVAYLGKEEDGAAVVEPLRRLGPELDTLAPVPAPALGLIHGDPENPVPGRGDHALLTEVAEDTIEAIVRLVGGGSGTSLLSLELRQLGGALGRPGANPGALESLEGAYAMYAVGLAATPEQRRATESDLARVVEALAPWSSGRTYLNFAERPGAASSAFPAETYRRLQAARAAYDPGRLFVANHPVEPAA